MLETLTWRDRSVQTHLGARSLPSTTIAHPNGEAFVVYDVGSIFPDLDQSWKRPLAEVTGFAAHHDAVAFSGLDTDFDGHRSDEEFARLRAIYEHHTVTNPWNGIGYHGVGALEDRIYVPRQDVLHTHRAHVSTSAAAGTRVFPAAGAPVWNRQLIGYCWMGNYADRKDPAGKAVTPANDRPTPAGLDAMDAFCRTVTTLLARPMGLRPHKYYQVKECPGDWASTTSWETHLYQPAVVSTPPPATSPTDPISERDLEAMRTSMQLVAGALEIATSHAGDVQRILGGPR